MKVVLNVKDGSVAVASSGDGWFDALSKKAKAAYIKAHPDSKYAKNAASHAEKLKQPFKAGGRSGSGGGEYTNVHYKDDGDNPSAKDHIDYHEHHAKNHKDSKEAKKHKNAAKLVHKIIKHGGVDDTKAHGEAINTLRDHHKHVVKHAATK